jgi:hypothetical protein
MKATFSSSPATLRCLVALSALWLALPAHAQFKVVGPDGKVTYTDRPPAADVGTAKPVNTRGATASDVSLPYELRQAVSAYPVTLYTMTNCAPCEAGRSWLRGRGIPYT